MDKLTFKRILPAFVLMIFLILIIASSLLALEQKKKEEQLAKKQAEEKIYLTGKFDPTQREDFIPIPPQYTLGGNKMYLRKETLDAFLAMQDAANKDKIELKIASATRNFDYQKDFWNKKWTGLVTINGLEKFKKILEYSAVPGASRHHWGTDIDINNANPAYFQTAEGKKVYKWLIQNAYQFGFCQPYDLKDDNRLEGYNEEKWHWSYLPLARIFTQEYKNLIKNEDIKDFLGDEYLSGQDLISNYVLGINSDCI